MKRLIIPTLVIILAIALSACNLQAAHTATETPEPSQTHTRTLTPTLTPTSTPAPPNVQDMIDRCPTAAEMDLIDADLTLSFSGDPTAGTLVCHAAEGSRDLTLLQERAYQALLVMKALQFSKPLPWTDKTLYAWFTSIIDGIHFGSDFQYSYCCRPAGTINIVTALFALDTDRWLQRGDWDENVQGLMVLMVHEARHGEGYPHTCGVIDQTIAEMGAYGVQYYTYVWLATYSDPGFMTPGRAEPDLYRKINRDMAVRFLKAREVGAGPFCQESTITPGPTPTIP